MNAAVLRAYLTPTQGLMLLLGFSSGLPLALSASSLLAWLHDAGIQLETIGLFAAAAIPYSIKFLWAPLVDGMKLPLLHRLGRRRSWMLATQLGLILAIAFASGINPATTLTLMLVAMVLIAFLSATQDVVLDAYRVERLTPEELGPGTAMFTLGYRLGMLLAGAGVLFLAEYHGWRVAYLVMAAMMGIGVLSTLFCKEPPSSVEIKSHPKPAEFIKDYIVAPFMDFTQQGGWKLVLLFIVSYKLGDAFLGVVTNPFLLTLGFTKPQIATVVKLYGFAATIIGTFAGGWLCTRYSLLRLLLVCGLLHALTNLMFLWQARVGADMDILTLGISLENFTGGLSSAVFVVFISRLCHAQFTATQYALLSSLAALGRTTLSSSAGYLATSLGWEGFFIFCVLLALPSLALLPLMQRRATAAMLRPQ